MTKVLRIVARPVMVPLRRPPQSASGAIPEAPFILIDLHSADGLIGRSYIFTFTHEMLAPTASCVSTLGAMLEGDALAPLALEAKLRRSLTLLDTPGLVGLALAGIDMAAWDALARAHDLPLARLLGGDTSPVPAYNSCGLWIRDPSELADEAEVLVAEGAFRAVKIRLGRPDPAEDLRAVRAVRKRLPDDVLLMSDFNQSLSRNEALARGRALDGEGLYWIEEPIRHDHYDACAQISAALETPIQIGENLLGPLDLQKAIAAEAADYYMPDVQRIGGVTGWLRAAALAAVHDFDLSSHLFPEFSRHLLAASPTRHWLEYMDWADPILQEPVRIENGHAVVPNSSGAGLEWDEDAVKQYVAD